MAATVLTTFDDGGRTAYLLEVTDVRDASGKAHAIVYRAPQAGDRTETVTQRGPVPTADEAKYHLAPKRWAVLTVVRNLDCGYSEVTAIGADVEMTGTFPADELRPRR